MCTVVNFLVGCSVWTEEDPLTSRQCFQAAQCSAYTCALPWLRRRRWASRYPLRSPRAGRSHACVSDISLAGYERKVYERNLHLGFHGKRVASCKFYAGRNQKSNILNFFRDNSLVLPCVRAQRPTCLDVAPCSLHSSRSKHSLGTCDQYVCASATLSL